MTFSSGEHEEADSGAHGLYQRSGQRDEVLDPGREALAADGRDPGDYRVGIIRSIYVSDDKGRDWPIVRKVDRFRMGVYTKFMADTPDEYGWGLPEAIPQGVIVGTAEECVVELRSFIDTFGVTDIATSGLQRRIDPEFMAANLERLAHDVISHQ
jgi:alkanesulfonate monooxygenase SsuD/methylene tetrahydromethanopterin reductase-like flavin-dependent oxidoreductase (luciferase family)